MNQNYTTLGIVAPLCYVSAVILGGLLIPGYSHLYNTISEISLAPLSQRLVPEVLFGVYNVALLEFGMGGVRDTRGSLSSLPRISFGLVAVSAVFGVAMLLFPQDPRGVPPTVAGTLHIVLAGLTAPATVAATLLMGQGLRRNPQHRRWGRYSLGMSLVILLTGGLAAAAVANDWPVGGLFERLTIGAFLAWTLALALMLRRHPL